MQHRAEHEIGLAFPLATSSLVGRRSEARETWGQALRFRLSGCRPKQPCCLEPFFRNAITSLSMSRLYVAQRIRGGLSGYSSSVGSPPSLRRSLRARRRALHTSSLVGKRRQAHKRAATKSDGRRAAGTACAPSCSDAGTRTTIAAHRTVVVKLRGKSVLAS